MAGPGRSGNRLSGYLSALAVLVDRFVWSRSTPTAGPPHVRDRVNVQRVLNNFALASLPCWLIGVWNLGEQIHVAMELTGTATLPGWLIVTGSARGGGFARVLLGSTVERVARAIAQPLLVVRRRVRGPYRSILVGVDGSDASRRALQLAAALFPDRPIVAFHVREGMAPLDDEVAAEVDLERFVDACGLAPGARANVEVAVGEGGPEAVLARYVRANAIDLAVLGLRDEPALRRLLMGSRSEQLLQDFACDTLLVPDAGRARDD